jgi:hypothetical protein
VGRHRPPRRPGRRFPRRAARPPAVVGPPHGLRRPSPPAR